MNPRHIRVGMGQLLVEGGEPARNLARAAELMEEAAQKKCHLVLLPECLDLGWTHPSARTEAEPIPGPGSDFLCERAKKFGLYVCAGLTERDGDKVYNAALLIDPAGQIVLRYRKINVLARARTFYTVGTSLSVVDTPFGRVGLNICSDNYLNSLPLGHTLARMGAEILLSPSSWTVDYGVSEGSDPYGQKWLRPYTLLAKLYGLVVVSTTSVGTIVGGPFEGKKMVGCSIAVGPTGVLGQGSFNEFASELVVAEFTVPERGELGTALADRVETLGCRFDVPEIR